MTWNGQPSPPEARAISALPIVWTLFVDGGWCATCRPIGPPRDRWHLALCWCFPHAMIGPNFA